jgi:hypothetical protein
VESIGLTSGHGVEVTWRAWELSQEENERRKVIASRGRETVGIRRIANPEDMCIWTLGRKMKNEFQKSETPKPQN